MERTLIERALTCLITAVAALALLATTASAAAPPPLTPGTRYLALGDSVTFGYVEPEVIPTPNYKNQASFIGYPEIIAREAHVTVTNAACPGETTASLIKTTGQSNGCENAPKGVTTGYRTLYPLHVHYTGSQLAFAVHYLRTYHNVRLVSLMIDANDFFVCEETTADGCLNTSELAATSAVVEHNIHTILSAIRKKAHYTGQIVIVNYYSLDYASALDDAESKLLNSAQDTAAKPFHVKIADGFGEFEHQATIFGGNTCNAGLITQWVMGSTTKCGIHPSYAGQALLAAAVLKAARL